MAIEPRVIWFVGILVAAFVFLVGLPLVIADDEEASRCGDDPALTRVFAASSLSEAFEDIWDFERQADSCIYELVEFNFAGSQELRIQIVEAGGNGVAVFASADRAQMDLAIRDGKIEGEPHLFARNRLVVIVPENNEAGIDSLGELARDGVKIVIAGEEVPVGAYTRAFLENASAEFGEDYKQRVLDNVISEETNVRQVVARVQLDEADAGIVYATDAMADIADDVQVIEIPDELNETVEYWIARRQDSPAREWVDFVDYVLADAGQYILEEHGFIRVDQ